MRAVPAEVIKYVDACLAIDEAQANVLRAMRSGVTKDVNLAVAALLRDFEKLTPEQRETLIATLDETVVSVAAKALRNELLLAQVTAQIPDAGNSLALQAWRRMKRSA